MRRIVSHPAAPAAAVLAICASLNAVGRGLGDSFMVFLLPLEQTFGWSRGSLTGIYSICLLVSGFAAPLIGLAIDRFGPRTVYSLGVASFAIGFYFAADLEAVWQFYLVVGVLSGLGMAALGVVPASVMLSRWFRTRLSTAMGIAYGGMGLGSLALAPIAQLLIDTHGWQGAYRRLGIAMAILLPVVWLLPWSRIAAGRADGAGRDGTNTIRTVLEAARQPVYWQFAQVFFFTALGVYLVNAQVVALLVDFGYTPLTAATAFGAVGMLSVVGMSMTGWAADRFGHGRAALASFAGSASGTLTLLAITAAPATTVLLLAYILAFGMSQGARAPIVSSLSARAFPLSALGTIYGTIHAIASIGSALGAWLSGVLHDATGGYRTNLVCALAALAIAARPFWTTLRTPLMARPAENEV